MGGGESLGFQPTGSPLYLQQREEEHWRNFDNSVNAVSFGFVATAILISMFLIMAIFERFLRPRSTTPHTSSPGGDLEAQLGFNSKLGHPSPKMSVYTKGVSVLMPGEKVPTYIAHPAPAPVPCPPPAPVPCPPERIPWPPHEHSLLPNPSSSSNSNSNSRISS